MLFINNSLHYAIMSILWLLVGVQGDIINVNTEVNTLMCSRKHSWWDLIYMNPMGPAECVITLDCLCVQMKHQVYVLYLLD